ncbi:hypothetical protein [Actinomycetospora termitidis]|uniref:Secreted protein n=1 Tax=Actinomycetospora termitidis TaxID=3053470 RepID=A0ABT7M968_9PSEU|nr:hypothetical protein [Actinomycetospora sp. Odt1-22]MDL5157215.1 hypothetical protein [Actinomycetospora sp. Odt1-22]
MHRSLVVVLVAVALLTSAAPSFAAPVPAAAEDCGVRVNRPHYSRASEEIHTRIESFCRTVPVVSNTVSGRTYRQRFWGWELIAEQPPTTTKGPAAFAQDHRETVVAGCEAGSLYRYRTEVFGTVTFPQGTYSASAYEENDQEILCGRP